MITRVTVENFKRFGRQEFLLDPVTVLAGPNNSGKTTLIQALSAWAFGLARWRAGKGVAIDGEQAGSRRRIGQPITRKDFTALPLSHFNLLWTERATNWRGKDEGTGENVTVGRSRPIRIGVEGKGIAGALWELVMEFRYQGPEQIYANPLDIENLPQEALELGVTHCPAFSGIGAEEPRFDPGYRDLRIGEGKPGDVLRNLLLDIGKNENGRAWDQLASDIEDLFKVRLKKPDYDPAQPFIRCEYDEQGATYDVASAGSGFHQVLLLFAFIYARSSAVLLVDEPDAHLHIWLQTRVFDRLRALAKDRNCQLVLATHAETILSSAEPDQILSFIGPPHRLVRKSARDAMVAAIGQVSPLDQLLAEQGRAILYCESESDARILEAWARRLGHPAAHFFDNPFTHPLRGRRPHDARYHLFGLRAVHDGVRGLLLLDGDNLGDDAHEIRAEGLDVHVWRRYEIENYLLIPGAIGRFLGSDPNDLFIRSVFMDELPASVFENPLRDNEAVMRIPASKNILPKLFENEQPPIRKADYYRIAEAMEPEEFHPEIVRVLDKIAGLMPEDVDTA